MLHWLCRTIPSLRWLFIGIGYLMLFAGVFCWFVCFPLAAYTLYVAHEFPFPYFGIATPFFPIDYFMPSDMRPLMGGVCIGFTFYGLMTIYWNVRRLRKLRLDTAPKQDAGRSALDLN